MGIIRKCRAPADIHPSEMAIRAAKFVLANTDPKSIDLVIWSGSEYKDYPVWSAGIFVQNNLVSVMLLPLMPQLVVQAMFSHSVLQKT